jgi:hypothetical protein
MFEEALQNSLRQIEVLMARNRQLEEKLRLMGAVMRDIVLAKQKDAKLMVMVDSVLQCWSRTYRYNGGQLSGDYGRAATQSERKRDLGKPEAVIICVGTNDLRTTINLDFLMEEKYVLVTMADLS